MPIVPICYWWTICKFLWGHLPVVYMWLTNLDCLLHILERPLTIKIFTLNAPLLWVLWQMARTWVVCTTSNHHANIYSGLELPVTEGKQLFCLLKMNVQTVFGYKLNHSINSKGTVFGLCCYCIHWMLCW
jgi:hypothetical protein